MPFASAQPLPDYEKNLQIHLDYRDGGYFVSAQEVKYGKAPNLNIKSGTLKGVILDTTGTELKTFSFQEPGLAYGDILLPENEDSLIGYTERPASGNMVITLPYLQDMQKFSMFNSKDGSFLVSVDLNSPVMEFCTDYPNDPDCLVRIPPSKSAIPDTGMYLVLAVVFSASVILAGGMWILTVRRRTKEQTLEKQVVLIVDDEPEIVNIIHLYLEMRGYVTIMASGGKECLDVLKKQIPDVILLDILMEPMDGWETLEQIKNNPATKSIPVLMLTGKKLTVNDAKKYRICIDDYIMKPFLMDMLYTAIDDILVRKQKLKESLVLAKQAGVEKEKVCELATISRRISVNKKIIDILQGSYGISVRDELRDPMDVAVIKQINTVTRIKENRVEQLRMEINSAFRSKGFPELSW